MKTGRSRTRKKFSKRKDLRGKLYVTKYLQEFSDGEKVVLDYDPSYQKGGYHQRFHRRTGIVTGKRGECYVIQVKDGSKTKTLFVNPVHLRKIEVKE